MSAVPVTTWSSVNYLFDVPCFTRPLLIYVNILAMDLVYPVAQRRRLVRKYLNLSLLLQIYISVRGV